MEAERKRKVGGSVVEEFYWGGRLVVYVDNKKFIGTFTDAVAELSGLSTKKDNTND